MTRLTLTVVLLVILPVLADEAQVVDITLDSYQITPPRVVVQANRQVILRATNIASFIPHNLVIAAPAAGIDVNLLVRAGKSAETQFTPTAAGSYDLYCDKQPPIGKSHREKGMHAVLVVE